MADEAKTQAITAMQVPRTHSMSLGYASTRRTDRNIRIHAQDGDRIRRSGKICQGKIAPCAEPDHRYVFSVMLVSGHTLQWFAIDLIHLRRHASGLTWLDPHIHHLGNIYAKMMEAVASPHVTAQRHARLLDRAESALGVTSVCASADIPSRPR
jgi:hypothetical protein